MVRRTAAMARVRMWRLDGRKEAAPAWWGSGRMAMLVMLLRVKHVLSLLGLWYPRGHGHVVVVAGGCMCRRDRFEEVR